MGAGRSACAARGGAAAPAAAGAEGGCPTQPAWEPLPDSPVPELAQAYSCDVLNTTKGLLRGCWGTFTAEAFYRPLPGDEAVSAIRHILICALDIVRYAEREGEQVQAAELGEGSYARVFGSTVMPVAAKIVTDRERPWVHKALVENSLEADRHAVGPRIYGHGVVEQKKGGHFSATVLFMERLDPLEESTWSEDDTTELLRTMGRLSQVAFHNDLKLPNVLRRAGRPVVVDYDLMAPWTVKIAVTSSCIEQDFRALLEPAGQLCVQHFREYYDLFAFSLTLEDGCLFRGVLRRLEDLWAELAEPALGPISRAFGADALTQIPFEVLVRVPLHATTVNLLDLRGNLFAHLPRDDASSDAQREAACARLPQLLRSNGVYWP